MRWRPSSSPAPSPARAWTWCGCGTTCCRADTTGARAPAGLALAARFPSGACHCCCGIDCCEGKSGRLSAAWPSRVLARPPRATGYPCLRPPERRMPACRPGYRACRHEAAGGPAEFLIDESFSVPGGGRVVRGGGSCGLGAARQLEALGRLPATMPCQPSHPLLPSHALRSPSPPTPSLPLNPQAWAQWWRAPSSAA